VIRRLGLRGWINGSEHREGDAKPNDCLPGLVALKWDTPPSPLAASDTPKRQDCWHYGVVHIGAIAYARPFQ
jgi:hypothetical protein